MKILFITELYPVNNKGGEFLRSYGITKILDQSSHAVYCICGEEFSPISVSEFKKIKFDYYNFRSHYTLNRILDAFKKFRRQKDLVLKIDTVLKEFKPDIVFIDYNYYGQYIPYFKKHGIPVIYGTHNVQSRLYLQLPALSIKDKLVRWFVYCVFQVHERFYLPQSDIILTVSRDDSAYYKKYIKDHKIYCIPNFLDINDYTLLTKLPKQNYIIMPANFLAYQNKVGLKWFLDEVWDDELAKNTSLHVIGRNSDKYLDELCLTKKYTNVRALGEVDDIKPYISQAKATIVPLLQGSGTRLKCIESMALKTQLISTSIGAEGIEHEGSIIISDKPDDFKKKIMSLLNMEHDNTQKAFDIFQRKYSLQSYRSVFEQFFNQAKNGFKRSVR